MWSQIKSTAFVLGMALLLASCGFHLRGQIDLPPALSRVQVSGLDQNHELRRHLERSLEANGVEVVSAGAEGAARLTLGNYRETREILVVGTDGRVQEYRLISSINASLRAEDLELPSTAFNVYRDFNYDPDDVLGKAEEEKQLRTDMDRDLSQLILQRLGALAQ